MNKLLNKQNDFGIALKPIFVRLKVTELVVVAIIKNVSNDFIIVVNVLYYFLSLFGFVVFVLEVCNHFFNLVDMVIKTVNLNQFLFSSLSNVIIF